MKELKVRQYDTETKKWIHTRVGNIDELSFATGYKDKNGKEIYSGDRISFRDEDGELHTATVGFNMIKGFWMMWSKINYRKDIEYWFKEHKDDIKIIGNIWSKKDEQT